jgi:hypothetical protein
MPAVAGPSAEMMRHHSGCDCPLHARADDGVPLGTSRRELMRSGTAALIASGFLGVVPLFDPAQAQAPARPTEPSSKEARS